MRTPAEEREDLAVLASLLTTLRTTTSRGMKEELLEERIIYHPRLVDYLHAALDPYRVYRITSASTVGVVQNGPATHAGSLLSFLAKCAAGQGGVTIARENWVAMSRRWADPQHMAAAAVLDKNLDCGVDVATVNPILQRAGHPIIPTHNVALGEPWDKATDFTQIGEWVGSRKFDGLRMNALLTEGREPLLLSRSGKEFHTLQRIADAFADYAGPPIVVDGEVAIRTPDGSDDFSGIQREYSRLNHTIENPIFHVFDYIPRDVFNAGAGGAPLRDRYDELKAFVEYLESPRIVVVKQNPVRSMADIRRGQSVANEKGWEGVVFRRWDLPYNGKKSKDILKEKPFFDAEFRVVGIVTDEMRIKVGAGTEVVPVMARANILYEGNVVGVGSGWSVEQRRHYYAAPQDLIGKIITVRYTEPSEDEHGNPSLRFPRFKAFHGKARTT